MQTDDQEVIYSSTLTASDVRDYVARAGTNIYQSHRTSSWAIFIISLVAPIPIIIALHGGSGEAQQVYFITVGVMLLSSNLLRGLLIQRVGRARSRDARALMAPRLFAVSKKGLRIESPFGTNFVPWASMRGIEQKGHLVIFWLDTLSAYSARTDAAPDRATEPLYQLATRRWRAAQSFASAPM